MLIQKILLISWMIRIIRTCSIPFYTMIDNCFWLIYCYFTALHIDVCVCIGFWRVFGFYVNWQNKQFIIVIGNIQIIKELWENCVQVNPHLWSSIVIKNIECLCLFDWMISYTSQGPRQLMHLSMVSRGGGRGGIWTTLLARRGGFWCRKTTPGVWTFDLSAALVGQFWIFDSHAKAWEWVHVTAYIDQLNDKAFIWVIYVSITLTRPVF